MTVVTRNTADFSSANVTVIDPWLWKAKRKT